MLKKILTVSLLSIMLVACNNEKTIDASSHKALKASIQEITKTLDEKQKDQFHLILLKVGFLAAVEADGNDDKLLMSLREKLGGKTAEQVINEYK